MNNDRFDIDDPLQLFDEWYSIVLAMKCKEPTAMVMSTSNNKGFPSSRVVLLKKHNESGFVFFTNITSRKGAELLENPNAALLFYWMELSRQVRVEGNIEFLSNKESDEYYSSRSRRSQLSARASKQSQVLTSWSDFVNEIDALNDIYKNIDIPRPEYWCGIRVVPKVMEFWQEGSDRMHTRYRYTKVDDKYWKVDQLYP